MSIDFIKIEILSVKTVLLLKFYVQNKPFSL